MPKALSTRAKAQERVGLMLKLVSKLRLLPNVKGSFQPTLKSFSLLNYLLGAGGTTAATTEVNLKVHSLIFD